jgi:DNA mismatch endonuclease (patch repair protein)
MPTANQDYWTRKVERNIKRDKEVSRFYKKRPGWKVFRIWEHDLTKDFQKAVNKVVFSLSEFPPHFTKTERYLTD